ncbi:ShET2/EspL2 family type III secretion system effector toxin, partial [Escherichia coli]|nr:ShET2/EspL2 family type III secretion system effector toxin [Escherichia coli]
MPIINKPIVTHTELHSKNNQPYLSKKRDASINLNGQIRDKNGEIIQCRHISSYWSDLFYNNLGQVNYETLSSPRLLSEAINIIKEDTGTNNINGEIYFVENELWGSVIYDIFLQMEKKHETHRSLDIYSS